MVLFQLISIYIQLIIGNETCIHSSVSMW